MRRARRWGSAPMAVRLAVPRLLEEFEGAPIARAAAMDPIGRAYLALERIDDARPLLESALDIRRSVLGDTGKLVASSVNKHDAPVRITTNPYPRHGATCTGSETSGVREALPE